MLGNLRKIVMIGPVYPYKGGISHYTGLMYRALSEKYDVEIVSYKMQYPKFLFKKEQKDYSNDTFKIENTKYWIHTANPFNCMKIALDIKKLKPDMVIFQWWHPYFAPCYWILMKILRKYSILMVCHNVFPHEEFPLDHFLTKMVLKNSSKFIVQSKKDAEDLVSAIPNAVYKQTVHPTYNAFKFLEMNKAEAREILGIEKEEKILLFFGFVREYKGLKYLIKALPIIVHRYPSVKLYIVGDFENSKDEYQELIADMDVLRNVIIYDEYIPDREVEKYFASCDLVVLPYENATQSGIVQIAFGFEKPVIVTNVGGLPDVVKNNKTGYVVESKDSEALASAVIRYFEEEKAEKFISNVKKEAWRFDWYRMVEVVGNLL